jgi:hypothetical protein
VYRNISWKSQQDTDFLLNSYLLSNTQFFKKSNCKDYIQVKNYELYFSNEIALQQKFKDSNFKVSYKNTQKTIYNYEYDKKYDITLITPIFQYTKNNTKFNNNDEFRYPLIDYWLWEKSNIALELNYRYLAETLEVILDNTYNVVNQLYNKIGDIYLSSFYNLLEIQIYYNTSSSNGLNIIQDIYPSTNWVNYKLENYSIVDNVLQINNLKDYDTVILIKYKLC